MTKKLAYSERGRGFNATLARYERSKEKISSDDKKPIVAFGYNLDASGAPIRPTIAPSKPGEDYGCDPLGDGRFRMVPSGDIVDAAERRRRLARFG